MRRILLAALGVAIGVSAPSLAEAKLKVFACLPEWAALTQELGGERVEIFTAISAMENPEKVSATPALISALSQADLLVCTGGGFEDFWLSPALGRAQNPKLGKGKPGTFYAANFVKLMGDHDEEKSAAGGHSHGQAEKKGGHVHGEGNPHIQGDPRRVRTIAGQLGRRLIDIDPSGKDFYSTRTKAFLQDFGALIKELEKKAKPLDHVHVIVQHEHSNYLLDWLDLEISGIVEPETGVPPGPADLARIVETTKKSKAKFVVHAAYEDPRPSQYVTERAQVPLVKLPFTVGGTEDAKTLMDFYRASVDRLLDGLAGRDRN